MSVSFTNYFHKALVVKTVQETPSVTTVHFTVNDAVLPFIAGQYISVYFDDVLERAGKAYSLSSIPSDSTMSITVKNIGPFSERICGLAAGDTFSISAPFGFFNVQDQTPIIAIAAGVGIAPIWSLLRDTLTKDTIPAISVFLAAPFRSELVFRAELDRIAASNPQVTAQYYVTRESPTTKDLHYRRFSVRQDISAPALGSRFYICGSEAFVKSIWLQLMEAGVSEKMIVTETFFEAHA